MIFPGFFSLQVCIADDHIQTYPLTELTGAAKVDNLDCTTFGIAQEDILGLEIAVDDVELGRGQEQQRRAHLLRKLARQVEGDAAEVGVAQQVVQVIGEQLEDEAEMVAEHEVPLQFHCGEEEERNMKIKLSWRAR